MQTHHCASDPLEDIADFPNPATPRKRTFMGRSLSLATRLTLFTVPGANQVLDRLTGQSGPHFHLHKRRHGSRNAVIVVNGLLSKGDLDIGDWENAILAKFGDSTWYHLDWEAVRHPSSWAADLLTISGIVDTALGNRNAGVLTAWHGAMIAAEKAGVLLARAIARAPNWRFTLLGHSLGARVIHFALKELALLRCQQVDNVYLLGGAVGGGHKDAGCWTMAANGITGKIFNYYSGQDDVLRNLYRCANVMMSEPIGYSGIILKHPRIVSLDASALVSGHTAWKQNFGSLLESLEVSGHSCA